MRFVTSTAFASIIAICEGRVELRGFNTQFVNEETVNEGPAVNVLKQKEHYVDEDPFSPRPNKPRYPPPPSSISEASLEESVTWRPINSAAEAVTWRPINGAEDSVTWRPINGAEDSVTWRPINGAEDSVTWRPINGAEDSVTWRPINGAEDAVTWRPINGAEDSVTWRPINGAEDSVAWRPINGAEAEPGITFTYGAKPVLPRPPFYGAGGDKPHFPIPPFYGDEDSVTWRPINAEVVI